MGQQRPGFKANLKLWLLIFFTAPCQPYFIIPADTEAEFARVTAPPATDAPPTSTPAKALHFLETMNSRLRRLQKPLGILVLGNVAVGSE